MEDVNSGQEACNTTINGGAVQNVYSGGTATGTIINAGRQTVSGGTATNTTINGGLLYLRLNGVATGTTINGGKLSVFSGTATDVVMKGGELDMGGGSGGKLSGSLEVHGTGSKATTTNGFSSLKFVLPASMAAGDTMLTVSNAADLGSASISISDPVPSLALGDTFTLISRVSGTPTPTSISVGGYEFELSVSTGGGLIAQVIGLPTYSVNIDPGITDGSITGCNPLTVEHGTTLSITCTATPDAGYILTSLTLTDSTGNTVTCNAATCDLPNVQGDVTVTGRFQKDNYNITDVSDWAEGTVSCTPDQVQYGDSTYCTAFPVKGYVFDKDMNVTGARIDSCDDSGCWLITEAGGVTVEGLFSKEKYAITDASDPAEGSITCTPDPVQYGDSTTCTATPATGYVFDKTMSVTGATLGACDATGCELTNATGAVTVTGQFSKEMFAITDASDPAEGSITCMPNPVPYGGTVTCTAAPASGYELSGVSSSGGVSWTCDPEALTCTSSPITSALTVAATFSRAPACVYGTDTLDPNACAGGDANNSSPAMGDIGLLLAGMALAGAAAPALRRRERKTRV